MSNNNKGLFFFPLVSKDYFFKWKLSSTSLKEHYKIIYDYSLFSTIFKFKWFRFVLFSGLGYKRKIFKKENIMFTYIGDRHWILYKFLNPTFIFPIKRRNFLFFSPAKNWFNLDYNFFSSLRRPYVYKMKGFLDARVKRRFIFVRRLRIKGIKTKLSKKQQML